MMKISLIQVPWDSGYYNERMGRGPIQLVQQGIVEFLKTITNSIETCELKLSEDFATEVGAAKELNILLSKEIHHARNKGKFPIVLAGNCNTAIGTVAGFASDKPGIIWFDAHADFNTPDTTTSGFFDAMGLSILTGNSWKQWCKSIPKFTPVSEQNVILIGARDFDSEEFNLLQSSSIKLIPVSEIRNNLEMALSHRLQSLSQYSQELYIHIDLDVFDPALLKANEFYAKQGLFLHEMIEIIKILCTKFSIGAITFASFDPSFSEDNQGYKIVKSILGTTLPMI